MVVGGGEAGGCVESIPGILAAKERKERKEQTRYFYAFSAIFRG
jgi:hypothetical protein